MKNAIIAWISAISGLLGYEVWALWPGKSDMTVSNAMKTTNTKTVRPLLLGLLCLLLLALPGGQAAWAVGQLVYSGGDTSGGGTTIFGPFIHP